MRDLAKRVNAGVSSAGAVNDYTPSDYLPKRTFQMVLHGVASRLALPPPEWATVIRQQKLQPLKGRRLYQRVHEANQPSSLPKNASAMRAGTVLSAKRRQKRSAALSNGEAPTSDDRLLPA